MIGGDGSAGERCPLVVRVLLIDEDLSSLDSLDKMLRKCDYKVSKSGSLQEGFDLLKERKDGFDIVICDADGSDSFNIVHHVSREMDIPVMMMSSDKDTSKVIKGVQHGACFYIQKPIKMKELRMIFQIFQHVVRAKGRPNEIQVKGNGGAEDSDLSNTSSNSRKRKEIDNGDTSTSSKKSRVVWTPYLHQKFVEVVNKIGLEKGGPKRILNMMGVEGLTRENVASHLQKYRLSLSRATQKQNDINPTPKPMPTPTPTPAGHPPVHLSYQSLSDQVALFGQPKIESYGAATLPTLVHPENDSNSLGMAYDHSLFLDADTLGVSMPYLSCSTFENSVSSSYGFPSPSTSYGNNAAVFYSHGQVPSHLTNSIVEYGAAACNSDQSMFTHLRQCELLLSKHGVDLDSFSCNTEQDGDLSKLY